MNFKDFLKRILPILGILVSVFLILTFQTACKSTDNIEYITETEFVPVYTDYTDVVEQVILLKPDNSTYTVKTGDLTILDIVYNSHSYLKAWQAWQIYAIALESTLIDIRDTNLAKMN